LNLVCICAFALLFCVSPRAAMPADWAGEAERLIRSGNTQEGLAALARAAEQPGGSAESEDHIGFLFAVLGRQSEAAAHFEKSLSSNPGYAPAHYHLGVARWLGNDNDGGLPELENAVRLAPSVFDYRFRLGSAYLAISRFEPATTELQETVAIDKTQAAAWNALGQARNGYATASDPKSPAARYDLAIALKMQDRLKPAQKELREAIRLDSSLAEAHYTLGITNWQSGGFAATIREMKAALAIRSDYAEARYMLGIVLKQTGDLDAALPELKEAIRLDPSTPGPFNTLGQILRIKGDKQASEEAFATGARLKREKEGQLANTLEQGMRGGSFPKPLSGPSR
jgi:tetratricopeptide (TPR) repeat protein